MFCDSRGVDVLPRISSGRVLGVVQMTVAEFKLPESMAVRMEADRVFRANNPAPPQRIEGGRVVESWEERQARIAWQQSMVAHRQQYRDSIAVGRNPSPSAARPPVPAAASHTVSGPDATLARLKDDLAKKDAELVATMQACAAEKDRPYVADWIANVGNCRDTFAEFTHFAAYQRHQSR